MSSASDQKLFCGVCSALKYSFYVFVGEKVVSPSYSSAILAPPKMQLQKTRVFEIFETGFYIHGSKIIPK